MRVCVQTSMFREGFPAALAARLREVIPQGARFAFVASEFEKQHEKTDKYFQRFFEMFTACGIEFADASAVDGRMTPAQAQKTAREADVVWLSGGDTPVQYAYFEKYGLTDVLRAHGGVIIGMSAGAINMAETAVCTLTCGHDKLYVYPALGVVPVSVEPHFDGGTVAQELLELSEARVLYGLCDEGAIVYENGNVTFFGDVFRLENGRAEQISFA